MGTYPDCRLLGLRGECQPRADDLLLSVYHLPDGHRLSGRSHQGEADVPFPQGHGRLRGRCGHRHQSQYFQPLPHMAVWAGEYAREERTREKELGQPDQQRTGPRLYHPVELWH